MGFMLRRICGCLCLLFQNYEFSPSARYELSDGTVLECVIAADDERIEVDSALYHNVAAHTDLLPNVYEG